MKRAVKSGDILWRNVDQAYKELRKYIDCVFDEIDLLTIDGGLTEKDLEIYNELLRLKSVLTKRR